MADDEVVVHHGPVVHRCDGLAPATEVEVCGRRATTLPRPGELLSVVATVNDVHFGETEAGRVEGAADWPTFRVAEGATPYPEVMNAGAVREIAATGADLVVAKGDLTSNGTVEEYERFRAVYEGAFGDRLVHVRGNHESYHHLQVAAVPFQERHLPGVSVVLLDTSRDGRVNGDLDADQLERLDELAARADRPVMVMGHHPVWNPTEEPRSDATFHLVPDATEALCAVVARRPRIVGYFAGHTHRNRVVHLPGAGDRPFVEVACVKDYPGTWAEYRVFDGGILQVHRRVSTPDALEWTERTRHMFGGAYRDYAFGRLPDRCFAMGVGERVAS